VKRVLVVKLSSLGDVIHTLPALTEAKQQLKQIQFDWVVEPAFAEIPTWHKAVNRVITCPLRKWRKAPWQLLNQGPPFLKQIRQTPYDAILDAQGLIKSAWVATLAKGPRFGFDKDCVREFLASLFYHQQFNIPKGQHALDRIRQLFAKALNYPLSPKSPDYGIDCCHLPHLDDGDNLLLFFHGTTWQTKHWPELYWQHLAKQAIAKGFKVLLPWGDEREYARAKRIQADFKAAIVLPRLSLREIAGLIVKAKAIVALDSGLSHLAAAIGTPTVTLYGPTDPLLTGARGMAQHHLKVALPCAPCLRKKCQYVPLQPPCWQDLTPMRVWQALAAIL